MKFLNFKQDLMIEETLTLQYLPKSNISELKVEIVIINEHKFALN